MVTRKFGDAVPKIMAMAREGFKLSELKGLDLAVAKRLIDQGKLAAYPLRGDWIVTPND